MHYFYLLFDDQITDFKSHFETFTILNSLLHIICSTIYSTFKRFEGDGVDTLMPTLIYIGLQLALLAVALWKCNSMGLLPMTSADWVSSIPIRETMESTIFPSNVE